MSRVLAAAATRGPHVMEQDEVTEGLLLLLGDIAPRQEALLRRVHANAGVARRGFVLPAAEYLQSSGFGTRQHQDVAAGSDLLLGVAEEALGKADVDPERVDLCRCGTAPAASTPTPRW